MLLRITTLAITMFLLAACGGGDTEVAGPPPQTAEPTAVVATATTVPAPTRAPTEAPTGAPAAIPTPTPLATEGELFLQLVAPAEAEVFTDESSLRVIGRTRVDAVVTINDTLVEPGIDGEFSLDVRLEIGANIIEVVVSVASGEQMDLVLVVVYLP